MNYQLLTALICIFLAITGWIPYVIVGIAYIVPPLLLFVAVCNLWAE
jgi:hypothetical protein